MKIPDDAFETYVAMGPGRSYQALADKIGADKRSITRLAAKEKWVERLSKIQKDARAATDRKLATDMQAMRERQLMEARALRGTALKAMKELPPERALKAVASALAIAWKQELLLLGDPTERQDISDLLHNAYERWLIRDPKEGDVRQPPEEAEKDLGDEG